LRPWREPCGWRPGGGRWYSWAASAPGRGASPPSQRDAFLADPTPALPGATSTLPGTAPALLGATAALPGTAPALAGTASALSGTTAALPGTTTALADTAPALPGTAPAPPAQRLCPLDSTAVAPSSLSVCRILPPGALPHGADARFPLRTGIWRSGRGTRCRGRHLGRSGTEPRHPEPFPGPRRGIGASIWKFPGGTPHGWRSRRGPDIVERTLRPGGCI